jgi:dTDP-4-dehydrorhamnose reductase
MLGAHLLDELAKSGHDVTAWSATSDGSRSGVALKKVDLTNPSQALAAVEDANPDVIIHAAAVSSADAVLRNREHAWNLNVRATEILAAWAAQQHRRMLFTSTDLVFDGSRSWYREDDTPAPALEYGRTKLAAENAIFTAPRGLIVRFSLLYGPSRIGRLAYFDQAFVDMRKGISRSFFEDEFRTPLDYVTAAIVLRRLAESAATGIVHAGGPERMSRFELMCRAAPAMGLNPERVQANRRADAPSREPRPADVSLDTSRLRAILPELVLPTIEHALAAAKEKGS